MRKIYILIALAAAFSATAQIHNVPRFSRAVQPQPSPVVPDVAPAVVTLPEGLRPKTYLMKGTAWLTDPDDMPQEASANGLKAYVATQGSDIYLGPVMVPFGGAMMSYMKGTVSNGVATFTFPCDFECDFRGYGGGVEPRRAYLVTYDGVKAGQSSVQTLKYNIGEDGSLTLSPDCAGLYVGEYAPFESAAGKGWGFNWIIQQISEYIPTDQETPQIPAEANAEPWNFIYGTYGYPVPVGRCGDRLYLGGMYPYDQSSVMQGIIVGDTISFAAGQLIGNDSYDDCFVYIYRGKYVPYVDPDNPDDENTQLVKTDGDIRFAFDSVANVITPIDPVYFTTSTPDTEDMILMGTLSTEYIIAKPNDAPVVVSAPLLQDGFTPGDDAFVKFSIPLVYADVNLLHEEDVYFSLYVDGELYTFEDDMFPGVGEPTTDIRYGFDNYTNIECYGTTQYIVLPFEGYDSLGLQTVYRHNGEVTRSDVCTFFDINAIAQVEVSDTSVSYYNLQGRRLASPRGLVITSTGKKTIIR